MSETSDPHASVRRLLLARMDDLSNSERKVARALLAQYPTAGLTTMLDLAAAGGVSSPTVVRFITKLGFSGFAAFQRALVHELNSELGSPLKQYPEKTGHIEAGVLTSTAEAFSALLDSSYDEVPASEFRNLAALLADPAREVYVTGGRFSRHVGEYVALHLRLLRPHVHVVGTEELERRTTIADADASTLVLIYDYRRYTDFNLEFAERMTERGATVCLMTDNFLSPIAKIAKVVIPSRVDNASPFDSLVGAMAISESLIAAVADQLGSVGMERLQLLEDTAERPPNT